MGVIFGLSSLPDPPAPPGPLSILSDKQLHAILYAGLAALVVRALSGGWLQTVTAGAGLLAAAVATIYGATDEVHQYFIPPRQMDARDLAADAVGASFAVFVLYAASRLRSKKRGL
jgi:VanZ family protein